MHRRADRYRSIAIVKGYRTVKILWPTDECRKSSRLHTGCKRQIYLPGTMFSHSAVLAGSHSSSHTSARIRGFKPNRSTHSIPCKCACVAWVPVRAARATDLARATPRPTGGDGDGPLADGRTPVECRTHCASSTGRQRRLARVEPVGRGGANGGEVVLRPPFTPRRSPQRARNETARGEAAEGGKAVGWGSELVTTAW